MTTATVLEGARKVAKNVAETIIGEEEVRGELWPGSGSHYLLGRFGKGSFGLMRGRPCGVEVRVGSRDKGGGRSRRGAVT